MLSTRTDVPQANGDVAGCDHVSDPYVRRLRKGLSL